MNQPEREPLSHVILCVHGLGGSSEDFRVVTASLSCIIRTTDRDNLLIIRSNANAGRKSHDGIDVCAERLLFELHKIVKTRILNNKDAKKSYVAPTLIRGNMILPDGDEDSLNSSSVDDDDDDDVSDISEGCEEDLDFQHIQSCTPLESNVSSSPFDEALSPPLPQKKSTPTPPRFILTILAHSLGGLIARQAIYHMFKDPAYANFHFSDFFIPGSFVTISSPHLGIRHPGSGKHVSKLHKSFFQRGSKFVNTSLLGRTGKQMYLKDYVPKSKREKNTNKYQACLLYKMCTQPYLDALHLFQFRTLIGATRHDHYVPLCSSTIRSHNPYTTDAKRANPATCQLRHYAGFEPPSHWSPTVRSIYERVFHHALSYTKSGNASPSPPAFCEGMSRSTGKQQKSSVFHRDNLRQLRFLPFMMGQLQQVAWRRLSLEFDVPGLTYENNAHTLTMGSWFRGSKDQMEHAGRHALRVLLATVYLDHQMLYALADANQLVSPPDVLS